VTTRLAQAIGREEGFGIPGDVPTRNNNPGDLLHAPGETHPADAPHSVGSFPDAATGWTRLENQLVEYTTEHPGITLRQMIAQYYAPPPQNDPARYIQNVCSFLNCDPDDTVASLLARG